MKFDDRELTERLHAFSSDFENWRLWLRWKRGAGHCGSIEWKYVPELLTEAEQEARGDRGITRCYILPAQWLEELIVRQAESPRMLIRLWWYERLSAQNCLHALRRKRMQVFPTGEFEAELLRWTLAVWNPLQVIRDRYMLLRTAGSGVIPDTSTGARPVGAPVKETQDQH